MTCDVGDSAADLPLLPTTVRSGESAMIFTCYYCNKDLPGNQIKRCSRCLLVTYCSKECQALSWKASHKFNCNIHPSNASPSDPDNPAARPAKFSPEWMELQVDRSLSRWLQLWRSSFQTWTVIALDVANHPAERVMRHCMQLIIQPRNFEDDPTKQYQIVEAAIVPISDVLASNPSLEVHIDPTDFTRLRFVVILQNYKGEPRRLRLIQWNDLNVDRWRKMDKAASAELQSGWADVLVHTVTSKTPKEVEELLGKKRS